MSHQSGFPRSNAIAENEEFATEALNFFVLLDDEVRRNLAKSSEVRKPSN